MLEAAVGGEDRAVRRCGNSGQAAERLAFGLGENPPGALRLDRGKTARGAREQPAVGVEGQRADVTVELRKQAAAFIPGAAEPPHLAAGGDADGAVGSFRDRVGAGEGLADRYRLVEALVGAERAVHRRNGVRIAVAEEYLLEVAPQVGEDAAHGIRPAAGRPNRTHSRSTPDRRLRAGCVRCGCSQVRRDRGSPCARASR